MIAPDLAIIRLSSFMSCLAMPRVRKWWDRSGKDLYAHEEEGGGPLDRYYREAA